MFLLHLLQMNNKTNIAVVIGTRFTNKFELCQDLLDRLDKTYELYCQNKIKKIVVSGKWTIWYDWLDIVPPVTEAKAMKSYLVARGIAARDILC